MPVHPNDALGFVGFKFTLVKLFEFPTDGFGQLRGRSSVKLVVLHVELNQFAE
jgi:hypothetical protein